MSDIQKFVQEAILVTKQHMPDYYTNTLKQRLAGPENMGSSYAYKKVEDLEKALLKATWKETKHPAVMPGCRVFKTSLKGFFGLVEVKHLPENTTFYAVDPKNTGKVGIGVVGVKGPEVKDTYLIIGTHEGKTVMFTFHPGEPIAPSMVDAKKIKHGTSLSKQEVVKLKFDLAKILPVPPK